MVAPAHIAIGKLALEQTSLKNDLDIYKKVYMFGCIAPDINFIYPFHNIRCTPKRFIKRLERMKKIKSKLIRSFTLGVIMHYLCDYFCLAHNNQSYGAKHTLYERLMSHKLKLQELEPDDSLQLVKSFWAEAVESYENGGTDDIDKFLEAREDRSIEIFELVSYMNNKYLTYVKDKAGKNWCTSKEQMYIDLSWSLFMCERVGELVTA